jgi:hypothetical protein
MNMLGLAIFLALVTVVSGLSWYVVIVFSGYVLT